MRRVARVKSLNSGNGTASNGNGGKRRVPLPVLQVSILL